MSERVLGPSGSKRRGFWRYRFFILPVVAITAAAFFITSASAVHDLGLFELDRNVRDPNGAPLPDDWATLYAGGSNDGGNAEVFTGIAPDSGDQFQAGGSKDNNDINQWLYKAGEPLDKDDITNGYAAGYVLGADSGPHEAGDFIVYFGLDRLANNGSAQVGFWFFKDEITQTNTPRGGGFEFDGAHSDGDLLVQSNFSQGGVVDSVSVFEWVGSGGSHGSLNQLLDPNDDPFTDCLATGLADDLACATVNQSDAPTPWPFTPKFGTAGIFPQGSFFEGGVNLTKLVPSGGCLSTFLAETRTSTPFDARLKDLALDDFDTCRLTLDTDASPTGNVTPGASVTDTVTATGESLIGGDAPRPTGTVDFFLCQPSEVTAAGCPEGAGSKVGSTKTLLDKAPSPPSNDSTAQSDATTNTTAIGKYCWRAEYTPDADSSYDAATFTNATDECFTTVAQPTTTTTRQFVFPQDRAKITAPAATGDLDGDVHFRLFDTKANCDAFDANGSTTGLVFNSGAIAVDGASPQERKTNNTTYAIDSSKTTTHFWHVFYDADPDGARGNPAQLDSKSNCEESTQVTFAGDDGTITVPGPANP
jgi:hypothetical protein